MGGHDVSKTGHVWRGKDENVLCQIALGSGYFEGSHGVKRLYAIFQSGKRKLLKKRFTAAQLRNCEDWYFGQLKSFVLFLGFKGFVLGGARYVKFIGYQGIITGRVPKIDTVRSFG